MISLETIRTDRVVGFRNLTLGETTWLCPIVKESHLFVGTSKPRAPRPLELLRERRYDGELLTEESDDAAAARQSCDVTLTGTAYNPKATTRVDTSLTVGTLTRAVRVHGARRVFVRDGMPVLGPAETFEASPLSRRHAYGGTLTMPRRRGAFGADARAGQTNGSSFYPRNRSGRGFGLEATARLLDGTLAPTQEDPDDPITSERLLVPAVAAWARAPICADYGPVDVDEYPRAQFLRPYKMPTEDAWVELARGWISGSRWSPGSPPDPRLANAAAPGLSGAVTSGQRCVARNLFPGGGDVSFRVPSGPRRVDVGLPGAGRFGAPLELRALHLRPDEGVVELTWCARIRVLFEYPEETLRGLLASVES